MKIVAVVVTYNRLSLLKHCVKALSEQSYPIDEIIVIDNNSSDGTRAYLQTLSFPFRSITLPENIGGAGGFSRGIREAYNCHADWIWLMDDDTIPERDALECLLPYTKEEKVGFINSLALWRDGSMHVMNRCSQDDERATQKEQLFPNQDCEIVQSSSFVSMLLRGRIPKEVGLPYKEFFIWADDAEYSYRIRQAGYLGVWAKNSRVLHDTATNYCADLKTITASAAWKLYYGERNETFIARQKSNSFLFFFCLLNRIRLHRHWIKKRHLKLEDERVLLKSIVRGLWDGFFFNPQIEYID